jgi:hypothetical protein
VLLYAIVFVVSLLVGLGVLWATEGVFRCALIGVICGTAAAFTVGALASRDAGPTTAWAGLTLRNPELLAPTVPATLENRADSVFRVMERNTTITLRILFPVSKRLFG